MRVSECVGLNLSDIDDNVNGLKITRKGGNESILYFGHEVEDALKAYIEERKKIIPQTGHEDALFLSLQKRRITVRAVENIVKKYASVVTQMMRISPTNYAAAMVRLSTAKRGISILWRMCLAIKMSIPQGSITRKWRIPAGDRRRTPSSCGRKKKKPMGRGRLRNEPPLLLSQPKIFASA